MAAYLPLASGRPALSVATCVAASSPARSVQLLVTHMLHVDRVEAASAGHMWLPELSEACSKNGTCTRGEAGNASTTVCNRLADGAHGIPCMTAGAELRFIDG